MKISKKSSWDEQRILNFLTESVCPLRLSFNGDDGFPMICSLWFHYEDGALWSASHRSAWVIPQLQRDTRVSFEVSTNEYPYRGVRGKATAELSTARGGEVLATLIEKYLGDGNRELARWLMSRSAEEYAIRIVPRSLNAWDFSSRMAAR